MSLKGFHFGQTASKFNSSIAASESSEVPVSLGLLKNYVSSNAVTSGIRTGQSKVLRIVQEKSMSGSSAGFSNWTTGSVCSNDSFNSFTSADPGLFGGSKSGKKMSFFKKYHRAMKMNAADKVLGLVEEEADNKIGKRIPFSPPNENFLKFSDGSEVMSSGRKSTISRLDDPAVKKFATFRTDSILSPNAKPRSIKMLPVLGDQA